MKQSKLYPRATEPDLVALSDAIRAHMTTATPKPFYLSWNGKAVVLEADDLSKVNNATIQSAVTACPAPSNKADVKRWVDSMPNPEKATFLAILDQVNFIRSKLVPPLAAITPAQFLGAIKTKADEVVLDRIETPK